ncbi:hypothetical protein [Ekhidna sp.]|uniref:hypothetical protein n=1 Tax=Ekhidna sp. TaxID=2608089 RepID=UPI0032EBA548
MKHFSAILLVLVALNSYSQETIDYELIEITCLNLVDNQKDEYVINSRKEYFDQMKGLRSKNKECRNQGFSSIDFNTHTLLGFIVKTGGCSEPEYNLKITSNRSEYNVKCEVSNTGACRRGWTKAFWVTVEKLDTKKPVEFEFITGG